MSLDFWGVADFFKRNKMSQKDADIFKLIQDDMEEKLTSSAKSGIKVNGDWETYNSLLAEASSTGQKFATQVKNSNSTLEAQAAALKTAEGGFAKISFTAKAASVAMQAASLALNIGAAAIISWGIDSAIKAIDNWINRAEKLQEAAENAKAEISTINSEYQSKADAVEKEAVAYEKLSEGEHYHVIIFYLRPLMTDGDVERAGVFPVRVI